MCLAVPGKIISINNESAVKTACVNFAGLKKDICIEWLDNVKIGDYILVHAGLALSVIDEKTAEESLQSLKEMRDAADDF